MIEIIDETSITCRSGLV